MDDEFLEAINEIKSERDLDEDVVLDAFKEALKRAFQRDFGIPRDAEIEIDINLSERDLDARVEKEVVETVRDFTEEVDIETAQDIDPGASYGDTIWYPLRPEGLSRTATHQIKQIMADRIQSGVQHKQFEKYKDQEGELVNGVVQRRDEKTVYVALEDDVETILPYREQVEKDDYSVGNRMKFLIVKCRLKDEGLLLVVSRTHPVLIERLFELHIPEVHDGLVEVVDVAREAGTRSKVAVRCHDPTLDPIGTCVGPKSSRIQSIVDEINGEKIDIIPYEDDMRDFIKNALSPAEVSRVNLIDEDEIAQVVVPEDQLSLAIGKGGQNARLTAKLCDWSIDIYSEEEFAELQSGAAEEVAASIFKDSEGDEEETDVFELADLDGVGPGTAENLEDAGLVNPTAILEAGEDGLSDVSGIGPKKAESILEQVEDMVEETLPEDTDIEDVEEQLSEDSAEDVKESIFEDSSDSTSDDSSEAEADAVGENADETDGDQDESSAETDDVEQIVPGESPMS
ncbi:MAG: transcription termination factor NusA [bacterium]